VILRYKLVRGALDFGGVVNRATARSRYGGSSLRVKNLGVAAHPVNYSQKAKIIDPVVILVPGVILGTVARKKST